MPAECSLLSPLWLDNAPPLVSQKKLPSDENAAFQRFEKREGGGHARGRMMRRRVCCSCFTSPTQHNFVTTASESPAAHAFMTESSPPSRLINLYGRRVWVHTARVSAVAVEDRRGSRHERSQRKE